MTCADIEDRDLLPQYAAGRLTDDDRDAVEAHIVECGSCASVLQAILVARDELARPGASAGLVHRRRFALSVLAAAAALLAAVFVSRSVLAPRSVRPIESARVQSRPAPDPAVAQLARIEPPAYAPFRVRSGDERAARFDEAMGAYSAGDFERARNLLQGIVKDDSGNLPARFYLGVCLMMRDDAGAAVEQFRDVIAAGSSPFQESARIFLAKALMRTGDVGEARRQLETASRQTGPRAREAADLLQKLDAADRSRHQ